MPLKLWLPLDGTNENRGISGTVMSGSPNSWGNGRTGKCAVFNDNTGDCIYNNTTDYNYTVEDFSWCMWLKRDQSAMTATAMFAFSVGRPDYGDNRGYGLAVHTANTLRFWFGYSNYDVSGFPNNEWHHVAFTRKGTTLKMYLDGILKSTKTYTGALPTYHESYGPGIGCFHYSSNIYPLIGAISDFRIYDHALSDREVYQISKALIVHLPLTAPDNAMPNLLTWTKNYTESRPLVRTSSAKDGAYYIGDDSLVTLTPGKVYYIQIKSDGVLATHNTSGSAVTTNFTVWLYLRIQGTTKAVGGYDTPVNLTTNNAYVKDSVNQLYVWKYTAPSNAQDITLRVNTYSDGTTATTVRFWDFKIEEGAYTSYVPSANQSQYTELGYGTNIVRDVTGRGNDGKFVGSPTYSIGSPRYSSTPNFLNNNSIYIWPIPDPISSDTEEFTISLWFNTLTTSGNQVLWTGRTTQGKAIAMFLIGNAIRVDDDNQLSNIATVTTNTWYHLAVTWKKGGNKIAYLDAVQKSSVAASVGLTKSNKYGSIGIGSNADGTSAIYFSGSISDFRIYGTALSASDIKELYATGAAIDNTGIVHAGSFEEIEPKARAEKTTMFFNSGLTESGGTQRLFNNYTSMNPVDSNHSTRTFTPTTARDSTVAWYYFEVIPGIQTYHVRMTLEWGGFTDITTTNPDFGAWFQGTARRADGTGNEWTASSFTTALNNHKQPGALAKASASGSYLYDIDITMSQYYPDEYIGQHLGLRSDYSNGTGWFRISKIYIYPADEHCDGMASITSSGGIRSRLLEEAEFD